MERETRNNVPQPALVTKRDSYARNLAEAGYSLLLGVQKYSEIVREYTQKTLSEIWKDTIKSYKGGVNTIYAHDQLGKYVHWRHSGLLCELWVHRLNNYHTGRSFLDTPHKFVPNNPAGSYGDDQLIIFIESRVGGFYISTEDHNGLGVVFDNYGDPIAYGGRIFAARANALNNHWKDCGLDLIGPARQSLLLLVEESKTLKFQVDPRGVELL